MGIIINILKVNLLILTNHPPAVKELDNGLDGRLFKLNENIFIAKLIKINLFTFYGHTYLIIKVKFKIGNF
jgi:hypothetical protein